LNLSCNGISGFGDAAYAELSRVLPWTVGLTVVLYGGTTSRRVAWSCRRSEGPRSWAVQHSWGQLLVLASQHPTRQGAEQKRSGESRGAE